LMKKARGGKSHAAVPLRFQHCLEDLQGLRSIFQRKQQIAGILDHFSFSIGGTFL
jgi:hypothetical protein